MAAKWFNSLDTNSSNTCCAVLTLFGMGEDTFIPLSFLDQILLILPLMIKIYRFDATWVMPQSFVQIRPNWNVMEYSAKKRQED